MDLYYHNESDPDSYCCPGDNCKSPPASKPVVLYSSTSSGLSFFPIRLSQCDSQSSVISPSSLAVSPGSFLFIICTLVYFHHKSKIIFLPFILCLFSSCLLLHFRPNLIVVGANDSACTHTHTHTHTHNFTRPYHLAL